MTAATTPDYNPQIVACLRILARRGRMIREAKERETADTVQPGSVSVSAAEITPGDDAERLIDYDTKILASNPAGGA